MRQLQPCGEDVGEDQRDVDVEEHIDKARDRRLDITEHRYSGEKVAHAETFATGLASPTLPTHARLVTPLVVAESDLVEKAAAVERPCTLLRGQLDVPRREEKHLVGHPLHAPVEGIGQPTREID